MSKKKLSLVIAAGVLLIAVVGGSLAWFTSQDTKTNHFTTGSISHEIVEDFDTTGPSQDLLPGDEVNKDVWINNTGKSDALLRVKITPQWMNGEEADTTLGNEGIELVFAEKVQTALNESGIAEGATWVLGNDGYFYYTSILSVNSEEVEKQTAQLLDAVRLSGKITDQTKFANKEMNVIIESETVQVNKDAYEEEWFTENESGLTTVIDASIANMLNNLVDAYKDAKDKTHYENASSNN